MKGCERMEKKKFTVQDYLDALKGAGPRMKEMILERAEQECFDFWDFKRIVDAAYPELA